MSAEQSAGSAPETGHRHPQVFIDLVREFAREGGISQPVSDEDACAVLDHFACPEDDYRPMPDSGGPEFWAELQRRCASPRPRIDARTVSAFLQQRWGQPSS
jgi:hypothetical protein